jgi:hypothetical protein
MRTQTRCLPQVGSEPRLNDIAETARPRQSSEGEANRQNE